MKLLDKPNPVMGVQSFIETALSFYLIDGNSYIMRDNAQANPSSKPIELWNIQPNYMGVKASETGVPKAYVFDMNGQKETFPVDEISGKSGVFHFKNFNPTETYVGLSPINPAANSGDIFNKGMDWNMSMLDNGMQPPGVFTSDTELNDDQYNRFIEFVKKAYSGAKNAGTALILEEGMKWEKTGFSAKDMDFAKAIDMAIRTIAIPFKVPFTLLIPQSATYNNLKEAKEQLWTDAIMPLLNRFSSDLTRWFQMQYNDESLVIVIDTDEVPALEDKRTRREDRDWETMA
jgi:HK97 family phage portal protein